VKHLIEGRKARAAAARRAAETTTKEL
jgi:hypothetical protein